MTKYVANPVVVDAWRITGVGVDTIPTTDNLTIDVMYVRLENGALCMITEAMTARMIPVVGDYYVRAADGYEYLNPKDVFEAKYKIVSEE